jgi:hypothetical protein
MARAGASSSTAAAVFHQRLGLDLATEWERFAEGL